MKQTVKAECGDCRATGLYRGFAEPAGVGVVCLTCGGTGCKEMTYTPFTERKPRDDVRYVQRSSGSFIGASVGPRGGKITYQQFLSGQLPE